MKYAEATEKNGNPYKIRVFIGRERNPLKIFERLFFGILIKMLILSI